jgi:hypothetical protein
MAGRGVAFSGLGKSGSSRVYPEEDDPRSDKSETRKARVWSNVKAAVHPTLKQR